MLVVGDIVGACTVVRPGANRNAAFGEYVVTSETRQSREAMSSRVVRAARSSVVSVVLKITRDLARCGLRMLLQHQRR